MNIVIQVGLLVRPLLGLLLIGMSPLLQVVLHVGSAAIHSNLMQLGC